MWAKSEAKRTGMSEPHYRMRCEEEFGSAEIAMIVLQAGEATTREAYAVYERETARRQPIRLGAKPGHGESVQYTKLNSRVWLRIWGDSLESIHCYSFDFVDRQGQYMPTPPGIKIYCEMTGAEVRSIEASLDAVAAQSKEIQSSLEASYAATIRDGHKPDAQWETYVVQAGTRLRIKQEHLSNDVFVNIPTHTPQGDTLTLVPYIAVSLFDLSNIPLILILKNHSRCTGLEAHRFSRRSS
ncbi:hypothetical protein FPV67DRAFT_1530904 [Lyophyllum atratum]|nr:hypothetical protein FPV67DRAFT_1530904 [Lyophyllum atratum]